MADVPQRSLPPADFVVPNDESFQALAEWEFLGLLSSFRFSGLVSTRRLGASAVC
jgi:hypothetical protein